MLRLEHLELGEWFSRVGLVWASQRNKVVDRKVESLLKCWFHIKSRKAPTNMSGNSVNFFGFHSHGDKLTNICRSRIEGKLCKAACTRMEHKGTPMPRPSSACRSWRDTICSSCTTGKLDQKLGLRVWFNIYSLQTPATNNSTNFTWFFEWAQFTWMRQWWQFSASEPITNHRVSPRVAASHLAGWVEEGNLQTWGQVAGRRGTLVGDMPNSCGLEDQERPSQLSRRLPWWGYGAHSIHSWNWYSQLRSCGCAPPSCQITILLVFSEQHSA